MTLPNSVFVTQQGFNQAAMRLLSPGGVIYYCLNGNLDQASTISQVQASEISINGYSRPTFSLSTSVYDSADTRWEASLSLSPASFLPNESGSFNQVAIVLADSTVYCVATWDTAQPIIVGTEFKFFDVLKLTYGNQGAIVNLNDS